MVYRASSRCLSAQSGVALAVVLWFLAAMALLVAGIVSQARVDVRLAQAHVARAKAVTAGDGAIQLMLASRMGEQNTVGSGADTVGSRGSFKMGDLQVDVQMIPASKLVDIFNLRPQLLAALLAHRGGLSEADAQVIASIMVQFRAGIRGGTEAGQIEGPKLSTPEDLLRIPGFNRALLDAISDDISAVSSGGRRGGAQSSEAMLRGLESLATEGGDSGAAAAGSGSRNQPSSDLFRVDAVIEYGGQRWLRRRWVRMSPGTGSELPWHSLRIEAPRVLATEESADEG